MAQRHLSMPELKVAIHWLDPNHVMQQERTFMVYISKCQLHLQANSLGHCTRHYSNKNTQKAYLEAQCTKFTPDQIEEKQFVRGEVCFPNPGLFSWLNK